MLHNATKGILLYPRWKDNKKGDNNDSFILNTGRNDSKINIDFKTIDLKQNDLKEELAKENNEIIKGLKGLLKIPQSC